MPRGISVSPADLNPLSAATDQMVLGEQESWKDESLQDLSGPNIVAADGTRSGGDFYKHQLLVTEADLRAEINKIVHAYKTGHAGATRMSVGTETITNGVSVEGSSYGTALLWRNITQDRDPEWRVLGRSGSMNIDVFDAATDLTDTGAQASDNDLSGLASAIALVVQLANATLSGSSGTITFTGTDGAGTTQTETLTFSSTNLAAPQTTTNTWLTVTSAGFTGFTAGTMRARATITGAIGTGKIYPGKVVSVNGGALQGGPATIADDLATTVNPVRLQLLPQSGAAIDPNRLRAYVVITGTDHNDDVIVDRLSFSSALITSGRYSFQHFKTITNVAGDGWTAGSTINVESTDTATEITYRPQDDELVAFMTAEFVKGTVPFLYYGLHCNQLTIGGTRQEELVYTAAMMGRRAFSYRNLAGLEGDNAVKSDISALDRSSTEIFKGWQGRMVIDGTVLPCISMVTTINQNLTYSDIMAGTPYEEVRPYRNNKRDVMSDGTILFAHENDIVNDFKEGGYYENVVMEWINSFRGAFPAEHRIITNQGELTANPDPSSPNFTRIEQPWNFKAYSTQFGIPDDFYVVQKVSEYAPVRVFA